MRFPTYLCALAVTCFAVWPNFATAQEPPAFPNRWGNAVVTTYVSPAGRKLKAPDPKNPTSYLGLSRGCTLGSNPGDRLPDVDEMTKFVVDTLASQGYVGSAPGSNEPELFIVLEWGRLQPQTADLLSFLGYDPRKDIGSSPNPGMLGPEVFRRNMRTPAVETVLSYSQGPIYGILLTAYDYQTVLAKEAGDAFAEAEEPVLF